MTRSRLAAPSSVALLWAAGVAVALLAPLPPALRAIAAENESALPTDKLVHLALFAAMTRAWLARAPAAPARRSAAIAVAAVAYGGLLELLQPLVSARTAEWGDLAADAVGVALAFGVAWRRRPAADGAPL